MQLNKRASEYRKVKTSTQIYQRRKFQSSTIKNLNLQLSLRNYKKYGIKKMIMASEESIKKKALILNRGKAYGFFTLKKCTR